MVKYFCFAVIDIFVLLMVFGGGLLLLDSLNLRLFQVKSSGELAGMVKPHSCGIAPWVDALLPGNKIRFFHNEPNCTNSLEDPNNMKDFHFIIVDSMGVEMNKWHLLHMITKMTAFLSFSSIAIHAIFILVLTKIPFAIIQSKMITAQTMLLCIMMIVNSVAKIELDKMHEVTAVYTTIMHNMFAFFRSKNEQKSSDYMRLMHNALSFLSKEEQLSLNACIESDDSSEEIGRRIVVKALEMLQDKQVNGASWFFQLTEKGKDEFKSVKELVEIN